MPAYVDKDTETVFIGARDLCEYTLRSGDINSRPQYGTIQGSSLTTHKLHTKKPKIADAYTYTFMQDGLTITAYTFPEGIYVDDNGKYNVEQIYTVPYALDYIDNGEAYIAKESAICSAYIFSKRMQIPKIKIKIMYFREKKDETRTFEFEVTFEEMSAKFEALIEMFIPFAHIMHERVKNVRSQLANLKFPFKGGARDGQRDFIIESFRQIKTHKRLLVDAPTGTGKTMAALYPALKSMGVGEADKVFYFTGKTTTALAALNAVDIMRKMIPDLRTIHITSKEKSCKIFGARDKKKCNPKDCVRAKSYYDKINVALIELLENYRTYTKDLIEEVAAKYSVCAYELSLEVSEWCELIVCDYNYLFDLRAYFRRYFESEPDADYVFLIDEAHNLPDRAREMYSCSLKRSQFEKISAKYSMDKYLAEPCVNVLSDFDVFYELAMSERTVIDDIEYGYYINSQLPDGFCDNFEKFIFGARKCLNKNPNDDELDDLYFEVRHLLDVCDIFDKRFKFFIEVKDNDIEIKVMCLDASNMLNRLMKKGISTILFSATLTPFEYFADVLGCEKSSTLCLKSPFDKENLCLIGIDNVSTRYDDRDESALAVANIIRATIAGKEGNYIVYFPSYSYLERVRDVFVKRYPKINVTSQIKSMSEKAKKEFLDAFDAKKEGTLVGFCVLGGSFSEGIDLRGERLIGAIIVGVGLPTISTELNIIKEYFDNTRENGYAYAYTYPGMNKVLQAAGRVIRSEDEKGVVLLIDDRFRTPEYTSLMPEYWSHIKYLSSAKDLLGEVTKFWKK